MAPKVGHFIYGKILQTLTPVGSFIGCGYEKPSRLQDNSCFLHKPRANPGGQLSLLLDFVLEALENSVSLEQDLESIQIGKKTKIYPYSIDNMILYISGP